MHSVTPTDFVKRAYDTAHHFGFSHIDALASSSGKNVSASGQKASALECRRDALGGVLCSGINTYFAHALHDERPALFFSTERMPRTGEVALNLHIVGVGKSIAEALLIQTTRSLLSDLGYPNHTVRVNSLGDNDSSARYMRELGVYLKRRLADMPPVARELMKDNALLALGNLIEQDHELVARSPSPLEYLSDASRRHFREIIEHLDMTATPYEIDTRLIGHHQCYSDALFAVELCDERQNPLPDAPFAVRGGRLDAFTRHLLKLQVPATGATVILKKRKAPVRMPKPVAPKPAGVFLVQLGFGPKIKSLMLMNALKEAQLSVYQALVSDSLSEQLRMAEAFDVSHSLILGQKEYVDGSVILRDMRSRSQETVPFDTLIPRLKRIAAKV